MPLERDAASDPKQPELDSLQAERVRREEKKLGIDAIWTSTAATVPVGGVGEEEAGSPDANADAGGGDGTAASAKEPHDGSGSGGATESTDLVRHDSIRFEPHVRIAVAPKTLLLCASLLPRRHYCCAHRCCPKDITAVRGCVRVAPAAYCMQPDEVSHASRDAACRRGIACVAR